MKLKCFLITLITTLIFINTYAADLKDMNQSEKEYFNLAENQIEIAKGSLIIAKGIKPDLNIQKYLDQIDGMAKDLKAELRNVKQPTEIVKTINDYIYVKQGMKFQNDKDFLDYVLTNKAGSCNGLSSLYLSLTERLQLPFYAVRVPGHLFVRYDDGNVRINVETTSGGAAASDTVYARDFKVPATSVQQDVYLSNITT